MALASKTPPPHPFVKTTESSPYCLTCALPEDNWRHNHGHMIVVTFTDGSEGVWHSLLPSDEVVTLLDDAFTNTAQTDRPIGGH